MKMRHGDWGPNPYKPPLCSCGRPALIIEDGVGRCAHACGKDAELGPHPAFRPEEKEEADGNSHRAGV